MKYVITRLDLGRTRLGVGWVMYDSVTKAFDELTPSEVKDNIRRKNATGLYLNDHDIVIDEAFCKDLMRKSGVGNFGLINGIRPNTTTILTVVSMSETEFGYMYEVVSNFCQRLVMDENTLKPHILTGIVNGVNMDENGNLILHDSVERFFITKPVSLSKDDLKEAKIDISTEEGISLANDYKAAEPVSEEIMESLSDLFDELDLGEPVDNSEKSTDDSFEVVDTGDVVLVDSESTPDNESEPAADNGDNKPKSKSKRSKKS